MTDIDVSKRMDPSTRFVRSLDGEYFMLREVAAMLGISTQSLRKTVPNKSIEAPSFWVMFGKLKIYLYTRDDIDELRKHLEERSEVFKTGEKEQPKVGRPRKYNKEQKKEKQREYARMYYWRKQLEKAEREGDKAKTDRAKLKMFELEKEIAEFDEALNNPSPPNVTTTANVLAPEVTTKNEASETTTISFHVGGSGEPTTATNSV